LVLAVAHPRARKAGSIKVTDGGRYGESKWYGRINTDGTWEPARRRHADADEVLDFLKKFAKDPAAVAIEYGKASGRCCFCGRGLKHGQLGYGPECAKKWGMPWTEKMAKDGTVVPEAIAATVATPVALGGTPGTKKPTPTKPEPATVPEHGTTRPTYLNFKVRVYEARSGGVPGTPLTGTDYTKDEAVFAKMWDRRVAKYPDAVILAFARTDEGWVPYCSHEPAEAPAPAPAPATPTLCVLLKHCPEHWSPAADTTIPEKWEARVMLDGTMPMGLTEDELVAFGATDDEALITLGTILNRWGIKADVEVTRI